MVNHPPNFSAKFGVAGDISWVSPSFCGKICRYIGCTAGKKDKFLLINYSLAFKDLGIYFAILWTLPRYLYPSMTLDFVLKYLLDLFRCVFFLLVASKAGIPEKSPDHPIWNLEKSSSNQTDQPMTLGQGPGLNQSEEGGLEHPKHVSNGKYHVTKFGGENPAKC